MICVTITHIFFLHAQSWAMNVSTCLLLRIQCMINYISNIEDLIRSKGRSVQTKTVTNNACIFTGINGPTSIANLLCNRALLYDTIGTYVILRYWWQFQSLQYSSCCTTHRMHTILLVYRSQISRLNQAFPIPIKTGWDEWF